MSSDSIWSSVKLLSLFVLKFLDKINKLLSGVLSSCDMFARNSDLYLLEASNSFAFFSKSIRITSREEFWSTTFLLSNSNDFVFSSSSSLITLSSSCCACKLSSDFFSSFDFSSNSWLLFLNSSCCTVSSSFCCCNSTCCNCNASACSKVLFRSLFISSLTLIELNPMAMLSFIFSMNSFWTSGIAAENPSSKAPITSSLKIKGMINICFKIVFPSPDWSTI